MKEYEVTNDFEIDKLVEERLEKMDVKKYNPGYYRIRKKIKNNIIEELKEDK